MKKSFYYMSIIVLTLVFLLGIHNTHAKDPSCTKIAILDTVAYLQHPDLADAIVGGYNFVSNQPISVYETATNFHGTHIAGIIAASGYTKGIYPDAEILYYVVDSLSNTSYHQNITKAIYRAIQDGAKIINFSGKLASDLSDTHILQAISYAKEHGIIFVKSCGNSGPSLWSVHDLATSNDVLSVGAYDVSTNQLYERSSCGPAFGTVQIKPDIIAPGVNILSTAPYADGNYIKATGTSMASAYASGALGIIADAFPSLSHELLIATLANNAVPLLNEAGKPYSVLSQGSGAISIENTLATDIIATPHTLSFIVQDTHMPHTFYSTLSFMNISNKEVTYSLTFDKEVSTTSYQLILPPSITLKPYQTLTIPLSLIVNSGILPDHYTGRISIKNVTSIKTIPLLLEVPSKDFPIVRGFSLSHNIISFAPPHDFRFVFETSIPSSFTLYATHLDTSTTYEVFSQKTIDSGLHEIGWDGKTSKEGLIPDGLYELSATFSSSQLENRLNDTMLLIDNTPPYFQEISIMENDTFYTVHVLVSDIMTTYNHVIDIAYRDHTELPAPLSISYSLNGLDYTSFPLTQDTNTISFTIPKDSQKLYLRAIDFSNNISTKLIHLPIQ